MKPVLSALVMPPYRFSTNVDEMRWRGTRETRLLARALSRRSAESTIRTNLLDESMAYQLVWPD